MTNLLKSLLIGLCAPYTVVTAIYAAHGLWRGGGYGWLGVFLAHAPMALLFLRVLLLRDLPRSHPLLPLVTLPTVAGAVLTAAALVRQGPVTAAIPGLSGAVAYAFYLLWYSCFRRRPVHSLEVGKRLPHCSAQLAAGGRFRTAGLRGQPAVLDADGRIVLADQTDNYRVRPEPATFIAALESA